MPASTNTVKEIVNVLRKHVDHPTLMKIVDDLCDVPGNKSFRDTIEMLRSELSRPRLVRRA
jgi:hypothetical protein